MQSTLTLDGTIGTAPWHQEITYVDTPTSPEISVIGTLDGAATGVLTLFHCTDSDNATLLATGSIAGTLVSASGDESETFAGAPPAPPPDPGPPPPPPDAD